MSARDNDPWAMVRVLAVIVVTLAIGWAILAGTVSALRWMAE